MHHQLLEAGLKNDACIREWIKREKKEERERRAEEREREEMSGGITKTKQCR